MRNVSALKQKIAAAVCRPLIVILLLYPLVSISVYFINKQASSAFSVQVAGLSRNEVSVDVISLFGKKNYKAVETEPGHFHRGPGYISGFQLQLCQKNFEKIEAISVFVGETYYTVSRDELGENFSIIRREGHIILNAKACLFGRRSRLPILSRCITWKGDFVVVGAALAEYWMFLVIVFLSLFIARSLTGEGRWLRVFVCEHDRLSIVLLLLVAGALLWFYVGRIYHANDDVAILDAIRCGAPVSFMGVFLGRILTYLYQGLSLHIEWYGWFLYLSNFTALLIIICATGALVKDRVLFVGLSAVLISIFLHAFIELTFTVSAILLAGAALYAFMVYVSLKKSSLFGSVGLGVMLALAYLIRARSLDALIVFFGPLILYLFFRCCGGMALRRVIYTLLLFVMPLAAAVFVERVVFPAGMSSEAKFFEEYNRIRGKIHGFSVVNEKRGNQQLLEMNSWSENDYLMFESWMFFDETKFTLERISNILNVSSRKFPGNRLKSIMKATVFVVKKNGLYLLLMLSLWLLLVSKHPKQAERGIILLLFAGYMVLGSVLMILFVRFPERIAYPLFVNAVVLGMLIAFIPFRNCSVVIRFGVYQSTFLAVGLSVAMWNISDAVQRKEMIEWRKQQFMAITDLVEAEHPGSIIIYHPNRLRVYHVDPLFSVAPSVGGGIWISAGGWPTFSPVFYKQLNEIGFVRGRDLFASLYANRNVYFLGGDGCVQILLKYLQENFDSCVVVSLRKELGQGVFLYQFARSSVATLSAGCAAKRICSKQGFRKRLLSASKNHR